MRPGARSGRLGSPGPRPSSSGAHGPNAAAHSGRGAAAWGWGRRPRGAIRSAAPWAALGAGPAGRRRGGSSGQGSAPSRCGPEAGALGVAEPQGRGPGAGGGDARGGGRGPPAGATSVTGAQRPHGRASRRPAPGWADIRAPRSRPPRQRPQIGGAAAPRVTAGPPPAPLPPLSPPLGRAPRRLCSSGPAEGRAPPSAVCRGRTEPPERGRRAGSGQRARALSPAWPPPRILGPSPPPAASCGLSAPPQTSEGPNPGQVPPRSRWASAPPDGDLVPHAPASGEGEEEAMGPAPDATRGARGLTQIRRLLMPARPHPPQGDHALALTPGRAGH